MNPSRIVRSRKTSLSASRKGGQRGFSMVELLAATAVFLIVSAAAFTLVRRHQPLFNHQQNLSSLNVGLRNALSQLQVDLSNAGTGFYVGANIPSFPIGVTLLNNPAAGSCYDPVTHAYSSTCFDSLHIISTDPNTPAVHPTDIGTNCVSTTSSTAFVNVPAGMTAAQLAAQFMAGDQLLFLKGDGSQMATVVMSRDGQVSGNKVNLQHNPTAADGTNDPLFDPLGISVNPNNKLGTTFCDDDWVLKLSPISYSVDTTDPTNPKLMRRRGGVSDVVADQVIGFKVGATLWNDATLTSSEEYSFDNSAYGYDYTRIRSVRVSLIGRTQPNPDPTYTFRNPFDGGPYQIQGVSVVVNPRNLSMKD